MRGAEQIPWLYDGFFFVSDRLGFARWRAWLTGGATGRVLEVGCGTGRNLPGYSKAGFLVAVDPHVHNLRAARRRAPGVPLVRASAEHLPFRDEAFDTVVSSLVFCSVPDAGRGLGEVRRVLATEGRFRMLEHVRATSRFHGAFQDLTQPVWTFITGGCHNNRHTEAAVEAAGFVIELATRRARGTMRRFVARRRT